MGRVLLEGGIIILLVLIGISVFIPDSNGVSDIIIEFEDSIENGEQIADGNIGEVEVGIEDNSNFIAKINCKLANVIVNGLNSIFELGMEMIRIIVN